MEGKGGVGKKREQCDVYQHVRSYLPVVEAWRVNVNNRFTNQRSGMPNIVK